VQQRTRLPNVTTTSAVKTKPIVMSNTHMRQCTRNYLTIDQYEPISGNAYNIHLNCHARNKHRNDIDFKDSNKEKKWRKRRACHCIRGTETTLCTATRDVIMEVI